MGSSPEERVLQARERLTKLQSSWEFAFAMGHGCSIGGDPRFDEIRREVKDLRAIISEHQPPAAAAS